MNGAEIWTLDFKSANQFTFGWHHNIFIILWWCKSYIIATALAKRRLNCTCERSKMSCKSTELQATIIDILIRWKHKYEPCDLFWRLASSYPGHISDTWQKSLNSSCAFMNYLFVSRGGDIGFLKAVTHFDQGAHVHLWLFCVCQAVFFIAVIIFIPSMYFQPFWEQQWNALFIWYWHFAVNI